MYASARELLDNDAAVAALLEQDKLLQKGMAHYAAVVHSLRLRGIQLDPLEAPLDDPPAFGVLGRGESSKLPPFHTTHARCVLVRLRPESIEEIVIGVALCQPGLLEAGVADDYIRWKETGAPGMTAKHRTTTQHAEVEKTLSRTRLMLFRDQFIDVLYRCGGLSAADGERCWQAVARRRFSEIEDYHQQFVVGARAERISVADAHALFGWLEKYGPYLSCRSHSTAIALVVYLNAYLQAKWPEEYCAAY